MWFRKNSRRAAGKRDADACTDDGDRSRWGLCVNVAADPSAKAAFDVALQRAVACGGADIMLGIGSLDIGGAVQCLMEVIGASDETGYVYADEVPGLYAKAHWPTPSASEYDLCAINSAREFLRTCAEMKYGILFS